MSGENEWSEDLFGCCDDCGTCCFGYWCAPCLFGTNAKKISDKNCFLMCCAYSILSGCYLCWIPHYYERQKLRQKYNLKPNPSCGDCPTTLCCSPCALCQEAREMKARVNERPVAFSANNSQPVVTQPGAKPDQPNNINVRV